MVTYAPASMQQIEEMIKNIPDEKEGRGERQRLIGLMNQAQEEEDKHLQLYEMGKIIV